MELYQDLTQKTPTLSLTLKSLHQRGLLRLTSVLLALTLGSHPVLQPTAAQADSNLKTRQAVKHHDFVAQNQAQKTEHPLNRDSLRLAQEKLVEHKIAKHQKIYDQLVQKKNYTKAARLAQILLRWHEVKESFPHNPSPSELAQHIRHVQNLTKLIRVRHLSQRQTQAIRYKLGKYQRIHWALEKRKNYARAAVAAQALARWRNAEHALKQQHNVFEVQDKIELAKSFTRSQRRPLHQEIGAAYYWRQLIRKTKFPSKAHRHVV